MKLKLKLKLVLVICRVWSLESGENRLLVENSKLPSFDISLFSQGVHFFSRCSILECLTHIWVVSFLHFELMYLKSDIKVAQTINSQVFQDFGYICLKSGFWILDSGVSAQNKNSLIFLCFFFTPANKKHYIIFIHLFIFIFFMLKSAVCKSKFKSKSKSNVF